ncbi:MAG: hypothetical protein ACKVU2_12200 [Saprospiraceae bacterium]
MRTVIGLVLLHLPALLIGQVFMRPIDNAASLALGGATAAYPGLRTGLGNDAALGMAPRSGVLLGSAIPFGIGGWQTARFQGFFRTSANDGLGFDIAHSGVEAYSEQRFRFAYGRRLGSGLWLGGSADVLRVSAQEYGSATGFTFNLSILANPLPQVWLGAQVQNPVQAELSGNVVPAVLRISAAWLPSSTLTVLAETEKDLDRPAQVKIGFEYRPVSRVVLRTGIRTEPARLGLGGGFRLANGMEIGVAGEWHPTLGITPAAVFIWQRE